MIEFNEIKVDQNSGSDKNDNQLGKFFAMSNHFGEPS